MFPSPGPGENSTSMCGTLSGAELTMTGTGGTGVNNMDGKEDTDVLVWVLYKHMYISYFYLLKDLEAMKLVAIDTKLPDVGI